MGVYAGQTPYGDIITLPTSTIDTIAARLYREQQIREQRQQQELKALDGMVGQNTSKMKDIDIPTFTNKVQTWKQSAINLLKKPPKNQQEYIQQQLDVQRKLADAQAHASRSIKEKEDEEAEIKEIRKNPYGYKENAREFIAARRVTPLENFQQTIIGEDGKPVEVDMSDLYGNIADDGRGTDFNPAWSKAQGKFEVRGTPVDEISPDKLTTTTTTFKGINPPSQMIQNLANAVTGERASNHFIRQHSYTDQEAEQILSNYEKLKNSPEFKNAYPNEPEIPASMFLSPLGRSKALSVMKRHLENPPVTVKGSPKQNIGAVMDRRVEEGLVKQKAANAEYDRRADANLKRSLIKIAANKQGQEIANGTSGNSFDEFGGVAPIYIEIPNEGGFGSVTGKIDKGIVFDKDGNLFSGEFEVGKKDIPVNVSTSLAAGKIPIPAKVPLVVKDGIIIGIKTPNGIVDREKGILNLQKKANTEPIKAAQPVYGNPTKKAEQPASKKEAPKSNKQTIPGWNN